MSTYGSRLNAALERKKRSRADLAKAIGRTPQAIGQVINGMTKALTAANNSLAAIYLDVNPHWLATGEGEMLPAGSQVEASNVTALPTPALRSLDDVLAELQTVVDGLSPLLQDAGRAVLIKWINGQASQGDAVATLEGLRQASATPVAGGGSGTEKQRAA